MSEKKKIHLLDDSLINKIAAGEVIENSASVIKELVENAIDASAQKIEISTKGAGRHLIAVSDNGSGIEREDLPFSILRHATSKIKEADDLFALSTFGFRGEALASIAAISKVKISTCTASEDVGHALYAEGGKILNQNHCARQRGTTIEVHDLFYNTAVRKKFLKSESSENREIHKVLTQVALASPHVHLKWIEDGKEEFSLPAERDLILTIREILGKDWEENLFEIEHQKQDYFLEGYISQPSFSRSNRSGQYLFVNNRPVSSPLISEAICQGYGTRIPQGRHPHFVLFLNVKPHLIDVNVHPQKKEVRFGDEKRLYDFFVEAVMKALENKYQPLFATQPLPSSPPAFVLPVAPLIIPFKEAQEKKFSPPSFSLLAIVDFHLLMEKEGLFFLVDAVRARRRIFFERITESAQVPMQQLLFPKTFELNHLKSQVCEKNMPLFEELKIGLHSLGNRFFMIDALPIGIDEEGVLDLIDALSEERSEKKIAFSLNHLIKRKRLSYEEGYKVIETLFSCTQYHTCPEGKPIVLPWPKEEIKRLFQ